MTTFLNKLLFLQDGELRRLLPFFVLYLVLSGAFSLADGLALSFFISHVHAHNLPLAYGAVAISNLIIIGLYISVAERFDSIYVFQLILGANVVIFGIAWWGISQETDASEWYGVLYTCREIAFTLLLLHFGTFLQDFFTRDEMNRVLPMVYSGGRLGGILGGALLQRLPDYLGLHNLLGVFIALCLLGMSMLVIMGRCCFRPDPAEEDPAPLPVTQPDTDIETARASYVGFLRYVWQSPLLFWVTLTTMLFILCRWNLNFQYSTFFGEYYDNDDETLAEFFGAYTQYALLGSMIVQILIVNRLVAWLGLKGAHLIYGSLLLMGMLLGLRELTFATAVFARLIETELRLGLRNPIAQLVTNQFPRLLRVRIRAWSMGLIIPLATLLSSLVLGSLTFFWLDNWVMWVGALWAGLYLLCSLALVQYLRGPACRSGLQARPDGPGEPSYVQHHAER